MITPNIAPRKITGSAAAGLFSAAKSSIRRMEKTTDAISKAPDVTKEQKFGINYVQFFGSKKNSKILKKSLKSIRDSLVATFAIAKLLRSEVSKNVKLIGDKTKKNKGLFGIGLGGLLGLISLLTNPIVLGVLGIGAGVAAGGFLIKFLYDNRDNIINFIMDKAKGLYDFLQSFVSNVVRDFLSDRAKSPELRNLEFKSEDRIDARQEELEKGDEEKGIEPLLPNDARVQAVEEEIGRLSKEQSKLEVVPPQKRTDEQDKRLKALNARINELKMGDRVHLIGFQNKLSQFLKSCDFVIMPSRQEGMPNVVMESMALGKPVLAANVNGVPELIEHEISGYIFEPYKIDAIRNAMNYVMKNKDSSIIKNWGLKAQDHVKKNFTIDIMLDNLESYFYEKINNSIRK